MRHPTTTTIVILTTATLFGCDPNQDPGQSPLTRDHPMVALTAQPTQAHLLPGVRGSLTPILTVGDLLPSGDPWAPIPDGLGGYAEGRDLVLFSNHELSSSGVRDGAGAAQFRFSRVSRLVLDRRSLAVKDATYVITGSEQYARLCSATFVGPQVGFPSGYFLTGEEQLGGAHDGIQLAIGRDGLVHELPWFGRFSHENAVAIPYRHRIVVFGTDDTAGKSELYMYVGDSEADLINGTGILYVFTSSAVTHAGYLTAAQTISGGWVAVPNAASLSSAQLQTTVVGLGAFPFVRLEDADYDHHDDETPALYFVDTGAQSVLCGNRACDAYGSIYRLELDRRTPTGAARLTLLKRSEGAASGWSSPDNIASGEHSLMLQEDPANSTFAGQRGPQIWQFEYRDHGRLNDGRAVVELENPDCDDLAGTCWESSGIIDGSRWFEDGTWLFDIQAHTLPVPGISLVNEGGQLLMLRIKD